MALTASALAQVGWTYTKTNTGFVDSQQGPDSLSTLFGFTDSDTVYVKQQTLSGSGTTTYDLTALTDFFGDSFAFSKVQGIIITCTSGQVTAFGAASNAFQMFLADPTDKVTIKSGTSIFMANDTLASGGTVSGSAKNLLIAESAGTPASATFQIAIIGKKV